MGKKIFILVSFGEETDKLQFQNAWVHGNQPRTVQPLPGCKGLSGFSKASPPCFAYKGVIYASSAQAVLQRRKQYAIGTHSLSASLFHSFSGCQVFQFSAVGGNQILLQRACLKLYHDIVIVGADQSASPFKCVTS